MKKILSIMLLVLLPLGVAAQKPLDEVARIKANDDYIWGEGRGDTDAKATQSALNDLISKISVTVQSETSLDMQQINDGDKIDSNEKASVEARCLCVPLYGERRTREDFRGA